MQNNIEPISYQLEQFEFKKDIDKQDYIMYLFFCCFDYMIGNLDIDILNENTEYNFREFEKLCIRNGVEQYAALLYIHCRVYKEMSTDEAYISPSKVKGDKKYQIELTESLIPFFSSKIKSLKINISTSTEKAVLQDERLTSIIKEGLLSEYRNNKFNERCLTFEEAKKELQKGESQLWIDRYKNRWLMKQALRHRDFHIDEALIEEYAKEHTTEEEVNLKHLQNKLSLLKAKKGRTATNDQQGQLIEKISYLIRFDRFLAQNKCSDIESYTISNEDCRFIFSCLSFFGLIDKETAKSAKPNETHNSIRTKFEQYRKSRKDKHHTAKLRLTELQLNQIKASLNSNNGILIEFCRFWDVKMVDYSYWDLR